ncbi:MAG: hypothetical protein HYY25_13675 [Candidatus Wallbacteria bacterium]|nr:hypothetical protein [Candidatus Wallbacteria bacterium]
MWLAVGLAVAGAVPRAALAEGPTAALSVLSIAASAATVSQGQGGVKLEVTVKNTATAIPPWTTLQADTWPPGTGQPYSRNVHALANTQERVVLFGGIGPAGNLNDTWEWSGTSWNMMQANTASPGTNQPSQRYGHALAFDPDRGVVVLFGGTGTGGPFNDTWEWDGTKWSLQQANTASPGTDQPSRRYAHALAFDGVRRRVILFGGYDSSGRLNDTWEWNGVSWSLVQAFNPSPGPDQPTPRNYHSLASDSAGRKRIVLFGGGDAGGSFNDTWEWNGVFWKQVQANNPSPGTNQPTQRYAQALAFDENRHEFVLFGGYAGGVPLNDSWDWDGVRWFRWPPGTEPPAQRYGHGLAFDSVAGRVVLFGGHGSGNSSFNDTRTFAPGNPAGTAVNLSVAPRFAGDQGSFTVTPSGLNAKTLAAGVTEILTFTVQVGSEAIPGTRTVTAAVSAQDLTSGSPAAVTNEASTSLNVVIPFAALTIGGFVAPAKVSQGQTFSAAAVVTNTGSATADITSTALTFSGSGLTATPSISNPSAVAAGTSETFSYSVSVGNAASPGPHTATLTVAAKARNSGVDASSSAALSGEVRVQAQAALSVLSIAASSATLSRGQSGVKLEVALKNIAAAAPGRWKKLLVGANQPLQRNLHALAYDSARQRVVLFGGWAGGDNSNDTWEWDGTSWSQKQAHTYWFGVYQPAYRRGHALAYDSERQRVVLFGGYGRSGVGFGDLNDTAVWDGSIWSKLQLDTGWPGPNQPTRRLQHALAYDSARQRVVLFGGGSSYGSQFNDTWEWDGSAWSQKQADTAAPGTQQPSRRVQHALAYDGARRRVVLFGGASSGGYLNDTWEWDGTDWSQKQANTALPGVDQPTGRDGPALAYDDARRRVVLFGGFTGSEPLNDTWEWDGASWRRWQADTVWPGADQPIQRLQHALAYDSARQQTILFGGLGSGNAFFNDTWAYDPGTPGGSAVSLTAVPRFAGDPSSYSVTASPLNTTTLAEGATAILTFTVQVGSGATTGVREVTADVTATDQILGNPAAVTNTASTFWNVFASPPVLSIGRLTASNGDVAAAAISQGQVFSASVVVTNTGGTTVDITSTALTFSGSGLSATSTDSNPITVAGNSGAIFHYTITATASATTGKLSPVFSVSARDDVSQADVSVLSLPLPANTVVQTPAALSFGPLLAPARVSRGQVFSASVVVTNTGQATADITSTSLALGADGLTATPVGFHPIALAGGSSATLEFTCAATQTAATGALLPLLSVTARDGNTNVDVSKIEQPLSASTIVQAPAVLGFGPLLAPARISRGQVFNATVVVSNTGLSTADITSTALTFSGSGLSATPAGSNPAALAGGVSATFLYTITATASATKGVLAPVFSVQAWDPNSELDVSKLSQPLAASTVVQTPAALSLGPLVAPATVSRGQVFSGSVVITNTGEATADITSTALTFAGSGLTAAPAGSNPIEIAGGGNKVFAYTITATASATTGTLSPSLSVNARDDNSDLDVSKLSQPLSAATIVQMPGALGLGPLVAPARVSRGQVFSASVVVTNTGQSAADITSTALTFSGSGLEATPAGSNPAALAGGISASFSYTITATANATTGALAPVLSINAKDSQSNADVSRLSQALVASTIVQTPAALDFGPLVAAATVSQGQTFNGSLVVTNTGEATANIDSTALTFSGNGLTATPAGTNPTSVPGGTSATYSYAIAAAGSATPGALSALFSVNAWDGNSNADVSKLSQPLSASTVVQTPAAFGFGSLVAPAMVSRGQTFSCSVVVTNTGEATADITSTALTFGGSGLAATPAGSNPSFLAGFTSGIFSYSVSVTDTAALGPNLATLNVTAADRNTGAGAGRSAQLSPAVVVQAPAALSVLSIAASAATVSQGQGGVKLEVTVKNTAAAGPPVWAQLQADTEQPGADQPPRRQNSALAYDSARQRVVLFGGGASGYGVLNDTWEWDGSSWNQRQANTASPGSNQPSGRQGHSLAYDGTRKRVVLFGGNLLNDTWEWDGTNWSLRQAGDTANPGTDRPPGRVDHALAYDGARKRVVLFGGYQSTNTSNDTWEWTGTSWSLRQADTASPGANQPPRRHRHALAYNSTRQRVVLFGGESSADSLNDTWEWDGTGWSQRQADTAAPGSNQPLRRNRHALSYDGARQRVLLFGGYRFGPVQSDTFNDTWEWDGTSWSLTQANAVSPGADQPPQRYAHAFAYDSARQRSILFGGVSGSGSMLRNDTWTLSTSVWGGSAVSVAAAPRFAGDPGGYSVVASPLNTTTLAAGATAILTFTVQVHCAAVPGTRTVTAAVSAIDQLSASPAGVSNAANTSWNVSATAAALSIGTLTFPARSWQGQVSSATVDITNTGCGTADITSTALTFSGSGLTATPSGSNPLSLAGGASATFTYSVSITNTADPTAYTATLAVAAADRGSGADAGSSSVRSSALVVQVSPVLSVQSIVASSATVSQGQGGVMLEVTVKNTAAGARPDQWALLQQDTASPGTNQPPRRNQHALAYDGARRRVVLFGGCSRWDGGFLNDTWEWDGTHWSLKQADTASPGDNQPPRRYQHDLAYDSARQRVVLFGGGFSGGLLNDLWEWDGTNWSKRQADTASPGTVQPSQRNQTALAYDSERKRVVLFGGWVPSYNCIGSNKCNGINDTWEWDGTSWSQRQYNTSYPGTDQPRLRYGHKLAYDGARRRTVLFGGAVGGAYNDTWEWDGTGWNLKQGNVTFPGTNQPWHREYHALAYDGARQRVFLFGGFAGGYLGDTWWWNGTNWDQYQAGTASPQPPSRDYHALAYDTERQASVLFGGSGSSGDFLNDTWAFVRGSSIGQAVSVTAVPRFAGDPGGYSVTASPLNTTTLAAGATAILTYTVQVGYAAVPGTRKVTAEISASDLLSGNPAAVVNTASTSWNVKISPAALSIGGFTAPARVAQGQVFSASVVVTNTGGATADITSTALSFSGAGLTASPSGSNPGSVAGGASATFSYSVRAANTADPGAHAATLTVAAADRNSGADCGTWSELSPGVIVHVPAALSVVSVAASTATVSWGQGGVKLEVTVKNTAASVRTRWGLLQSDTASPGANQPPRRGDCALAYDSTRQRVVLFGGMTPSGAKFNDTWEWDGTSWSQRQADTASPGADQPFRRGDCALAYDSARQRVVLFGGADASENKLNDTWEWDGTNWSQRQADTDTPGADQPLKHVGHAMAYDSARRRVVLFGGIEAGNGLFWAILNDTWEWDGTHWSQRQAHSSAPDLESLGTTQPYWRENYALAYDDARKRVVLFGGTGRGGLACNDTWEWDGTNWSQRQAIDFSPGTHQPPYRAHHALAYDNGRQRVILFGGYRGPEVFNDTWEWDGTDWSQTQADTASLRTDQPPRRFGHALAYDRSRQRAVLFGGFDSPSGAGFNDTWTYIPGTSASAAVSLTAVPSFAGDPGGYSVMASPLNTTTLAAGATAILTFTVEVSSDALLGMRVVTSAVSANDEVSGSPVAVTNTASTSWNVLPGPTPLSIGAFAAPARVSQGQVFSASVTVANTGATTVDISSTALDFGQAGLTATPWDSNPTTLAGGISATFGYTVTVAASAPAGPISPLFSIRARDRASNANVSKLSRPLAASTVVQTPAALSLGPLVSPPTVSQGQVFSASVVVTNTGQATAGIDSVALTFSPGGLSATPWGSNPIALSGGVSASFGYTITATASAPAGARSPVMSLQARDGNSNADVSKLSQQLSASVVVQTPAALSFGALVAPATVFQGQAFSASVVVTNTGQATAGITSTSLTFGGSGFTATPSGVHPTSLAGGVSATFSYTIVAAPTATTGPLAPVYSVSARDGNSNADVSMLSRPLSANTVVQALAALGFGPLVAPATVSWGQTFSATVVVTNTGSTTIDITSTALTFGAGGLTATPSGSNPNTLAGGTSAAFRYTIEVAAGATTGTISPIYSVHARDREAGTDVSKLAQPLSATTLLQSVAALAIRVIQASSAAVSRNETFAVTMTVTNTGEATATVMGITPTFTVTGLTYTARQTNPTSVAGGTTASFRFAVTVGATAPSGSVTIDGTVAALDANSGAAAGDVGADATAAVTVQPGAQLAIRTVAAPPRISQGQTFEVTMTAANTGEVTARITTAKLTFTGAGRVDLTSEYTVTPAAANPATVPGGGAPSFRFTVRASSQATAGTVTVDGALSATAVDSGAPLEASGTGSPAQVIVERPAALSLLSVRSPAEASRGLSYRVTMTVTNEGGATAEIRTAALSFRAAGGAERNADFATRPDPSGPASVAGGSTIDLIVIVTVSGQARLESVTIDGRIEGRDANSSAALSDTGANVTAAWTVKAPQFPIAWRLAAPAMSPSARFGHAMSYDPRSKRVLLFGGASESATLWSWSGENWEKRSWSYWDVKPQPRERHSMDFDSNRGRTVLFGGIDFDDRSQNETWDWDGNNWQRGRDICRTTPSGGCDVLQFHASAYDAARKQIVLFGGVFGWVTRFTSNETWAYSGGSWTRLVAQGTAGSPPARSNASMAYDGSRQRVVLFGGESYNDTWEWDGSSWTARTANGAAGSPPTAYRHAMVYDSARQRTVLFGGSSAGAETWEWDGTSWSRTVAPGVANHPSARNRHAMAYDSGRQCTVLFGGTDSSYQRFHGDTWEYGPIVPGLRIRSVTSSTRTVGQGQSGLRVQMSVENRGANPVTLSSAGLTFTGAARAGDFTVVADPANPKQLSATATVSLGFTLSVSPAAAPGTVAIDGTIGGSDSVTGAFVSDTAADTADTWSVATGAVLRPIRIQAPARMSQRQTYKVTMTVANSGGTAATLTQSPGLTWAGPAGQDVSAGFEATPSLANPSAVAGGVTATFVFGVLVRSNSATGTLTVGGDLRWQDAVFGVAGRFAGAPVPTGPATVEVLAVPNRPPVADAGPDLSRRAAELVQLDGSRSTDPDAFAAPKSAGESRRKTDRVLTYRWSFDAVPTGSRVTAASLSANNSTTAAMPAFGPDRKGLYVLRLIVNDGQADSPPDTVNVTLIDTPPAVRLAVSGWQEARVGGAVVLSAVGSDPDAEDVLTYHWSLVSVAPNSRLTTASIAPNGTTSAALSQFVPDAEGAYRLRLAGKAGGVSTYAGADLLVLARLPQVSLSFLRPLDGETLAQDTSGNPGFQVDVRVELAQPVRDVLKLTVNGVPSQDRWLTNERLAGFRVTLPYGQTSTLEASVGLDRVSVRATVPLAMAPTAVARTSSYADGPPRVLDMDARASFADEGIASYRWDLTQKPQSAQSFTSSDPAPRYDAIAAGHYEFSLTVTDPLGRSGHNGLSFTVASMAPVADAGPDRQIVLTRDDMSAPVATTRSLVLDGSGSRDPNEETLRYQWIVKWEGDISTMPDLSRVLSLDSWTVARPTVTFSSAQRGAGSRQPMAAAGRYRFDLTVWKGWESRTDSMFVQVTDPLLLAPTASVGGDRRFVVQQATDGSIIELFPDELVQPATGARGEPANLRDYIRLDGRGSSHPSGKPLTYRWRVLEVPAPDAPVKLEDATSPTPTFVPNFMGTYRFGLAVADDFYTSSEATQTVLLESDCAAPRPVLRLFALNPLRVRYDGTLTVTPGTDVILDATDSRRSDGRREGVTYTWVNWPTTAASLSLRTKQVDTLDFALIERENIGNCAAWSFAKIEVVPSAWQAPSKRGATSFAREAAGRAAAESQPLSVVATATTTAAVGAAVADGFPVGPTGSLRVTVPTTVTLTVRVLDPGPEYGGVDFNWRQVDGPMALLDVPPSAGPRALVSTVRFFPTTSRVHTFEVAADLLDASSNRTGLSLTRRVRVIADTEDALVPDASATITATAIPLAGTDTERTVTLQAADTPILQALRAEGKSLTYAWRQVDGPVGTLRNPYTTSTEFTAPAFAAGQSPISYAFELTIDAQAPNGRSEPVFVKLTQQDPPPAAWRPERLRLFADGVAASEPATWTTPEIQFDDVELPVSTDEGAELALEVVDAAGGRLVTPLVLRRNTLGFEASGAPSVVSTADGLLVLSPALLGRQAAARFEGVGTQALGNAVVEAVAGGGGGRGGGCGLAGGAGSGPALLLAPLAWVVFRRRSKSRGAFRGKR